MSRLRAALRRLLRAGDGRPLAAAWLAGLLLVAQFPDLSIPQFARERLFDQYQRWLPRERDSAPVMIVDIDEASLKQVGQWPWPRDRLAALLDRLGAMKPLAIGVDIYMPEPDQSSPSALAGRLPAGETALRTALLRLPDNDRLLAEAIRNAPTVLGAAGFDRETFTTSRSLRVRPVRSEGGDALPHLRRYPFVLASLDPFQAAARGQALLSVDRQGALVRRVPLAMAVGDTVVPSLAVEMLRVASGAEAATVQVGRLGVAGLRVADLEVRTQSDASVWLHFGRADPARYVSAAAVLTGQLPADAFENKLVLVGLSGFGLADSQVTPLGEHVPGVEFQAQLVESLLERSLLLRPQWMRWLESALLLVGGGVLIWSVPLLKARHATLLAGAMYAGLLAGGIALFQFAGLLMDAATTFAGLNVVLGSLLGSAYVTSEGRRLHAEAKLHEERESAARVAGELTAARRIQMGTLPDAATAFPGERRFEIAALLEPARDVGGDLYDFFLLDDRRLFFVVGDVSGKGVPASLFMAVTKALSKSVALRGDASVAAIVTRLNEEVVRENPEMLFVTLAAGILDVETGALELCVAGHDAPRLLRAAEGTMERIEGDGGPPLCMLEDFPYPSVTLQLAAREAVCLVTDGITEAHDAAGQLYGGDRLDRVLANAARYRSPKVTVELVREDLRTFVREAEASDDLTVLVVQWNGAPA